MLNEVNARINARLRLEEVVDDFCDIIHEDVNLDSLFGQSDDSKGDDFKMYNSYYSEDTILGDTELETYLQNETDAHDTSKWNVRPDITDSDLTRLQQPVDYSDHYSHPYQADSLPNNLLNKEVNYSDHQTSPVDITEFSNEAADILGEDFLDEDTDEDGNMDECGDDKSLEEACDDILGECGGDCDDTLKEDSDEEDNMDESYFDEDVNMDEDAAISSILDIG